MLTRRRHFLLRAGAIFPLASAALQAEHRLISANPLITEVELTAATGRYVSLEDFYIRDHGPMPAVSSNALRIEGAVAHPQDLDLQRLQSVSRVEKGAVLECAGSLVGRLCQASNGLWGGWWMRDVLALANPATTAKFIHLYGRDGFRRSVPIGRAMQSGLLASHLNGSPLRQNHGAPLRALFLASYGMDSVKWLERIVLAEDDLVAANPYLYMQARTGGDGTIDLKPLPRVQVKSVILSPVDHAVLRRGTQIVKGLAWSGAGAIMRVEVSADGGRIWQTAHLSPQVGFEWVAWQCVLDLKETGAIELACRATDAANSTQPATRDESRSDPYANNWYHRVACVVI